jgi:hypothetical protein
LYARKIKETTNGSRRCACGEARQEVEVVAQGRIEPNGEVDERKRATKDGKDEAQGKAHTQTEENVESPFAVLSRFERRPAEDAGQRKQSAIILGKGTKHELSRENIATTTKNWNSHRSLRLHYLDYLSQGFRAYPACPGERMIKNIDQK